MESTQSQPTKPCPYCSEQILISAQKCRYCGEYLDPVLRAKNRAGSHDSLDRMLMPVGRPVSSIAAGYLGLFSVLPFFGILAIIVSLVALRTLRKDPELSGRGRAIFGLVMGTLFTLLYAVPFAILIFADKR